MTNHSHPAGQRPSFRFPASRRGLVVRGPSAWRFRPVLCASLIAACLAAALPGGARADARIDDAWTRATVSAQRAGGAFMTITSDTPARLVAVHTPVADTAEIHEMTMVDHGMRMRPVESLARPAGTAVVLKPGGYHLMLLDLAGPLVPGDTVSLTLVFASGLELEAEAEVRPLAAP